jgi:hypothetical protein
MYKATAGNESTPISATWAQLTFKRSHHRTHAPPNAHAQRLAASLLESRCRARCRARCRRRCRCHDHRCCRGRCHRGRRAMPSAVARSVPTVIARSAIVPVHEVPAAARKLSGWLKRWQLAHAFLWEYSCKRLKLAQLLGQLGVFLTRRPPSTRTTARGGRQRWCTCRSSGR